MESRVLGKLLSLTLPLCCPLFLPYPLESNVCSLLIQHEPQKSASKNLRLVQDLSWLRL